VIALAVLAAGCGKKDEASANRPDVQPAGDDLFPWPKADLEMAAAKFGPLQQTATGLRWKQLSPGTGDAHPAPGDIVVTHYRGTFLDGSVFDESYKRGEPIRFPIGRGRVIKGWDEAILGMTKGEKRLLVIPYWLAYGEAGRLPTIPERATLVFEVELMGWDGAPQ
jgi:peptidylprolyl isomerase